LILCGLHERPRTGEDLALAGTTYNVCDTTRHLGGKRAGIQMLGLSAENLRSWCGRNRRQPLHSGRSSLQCRSQAAVIRYAGPLVVTQAQV